MRRALPIAALALSCAGGCFEPPVLEVLLFHFREEGGASATLEVQLAARGDLGNPGAARRVRERERALLDGSDPWLDRFASVEAGADSLSWNRRNGELRVFRRMVEVEDPAALAPLLEGDGARWSYTRDGARAELELLPARGGRAARGERDRVLREIRSWSALYARYVEAARALDAAARENPPHALELWTAALRGDDEPDAALGEEELATAKRFEAALSALLEGFAPDERDALALAERVRGIFHPFTAEVGIELPCKADEVEGFVEADPGDYVVGDLSLASAALELEGKWLAQDPLSGFVERLALDDPRPYPAEFATGSLATEAEAPTADEISRAILETLRPPELYRLAWSCVTPPEAE